MGRVREEEREKARRKLERLERGEEEDDVEDIATNDHLVTPPSPDTLRRGNSAFGAATTEFKDVRVKDAQRDAADKRGKQRENGERGEGEGNIPLKYLQREDKDMENSECTPYEEDGESERERVREREKEERRSKKEKRSRSRRDSYKRSSSRQADARDSSMEEEH